MKRSNIQREENAFGTVPHCLVFNRGRVGHRVLELIHDIRNVMEPYTSRNLHVCKWFLYEYILILLLLLFFKFYEYLRVCHI